MSEVGRFLTNHVIKNGFICTHPTNLAQNSPSPPAFPREFPSRFLEFSRKNHGIQYLFLRQPLFGNPRKFDEIRTKEFLSTTSSHINSLFLTCPPMASAEASIPPH